MNPCNKGEQKEEGWGNKKLCKKAYPWDKGSKATIWRVGPCNKGGPLQQGWTPWDKGLKATIWNLIGDHEPLQQGWTLATRANSLRQGFESNNLESHWRSWTLATRVDPCNKGEPLQEGCDKEKPCKKAYPWDKGMFLNSKPPLKASGWRTLRWGCAKKCNALRGMGGGVLQSCCCCLTV